MIRRTSDQGPSRREGSQGQRVPATLEGLVAATRQIAPSPTQLSRLAEKAGEASARSTSPLRSLLRPRVVLLAAGAVASFVALTTIERGGPSSTSAPRDVTSSIAPSPPVPVAPRSDDDLGPHLGAPTTDVRSLPDSKMAPPAPKATAAPAKSAATEEVSEGQILHRAFAAMSSDPERALALTAEHLSRFPKGMLAQERELLAIEALARLGRAAEARSRAAAFYMAYPGSAYRRRVDDALAGRSPSAGPQ